MRRLAALPAATTRWTAQRSSPLTATRFQAALRPASDTFTAHAAIDAVRRALPPDGVLAFDVGAHTHQIASQWTAHAPKTFLITNGWSSMGFGLPGAIAAKLARPDLPVVCLIGDGCFQMTCGEVATAKRLGITLPIVVLDDHWLALIKVKQIRRQFPLYGTELQEEDYREPPAHYFGVPAVGVRSAEALEAAVEGGARREGPDRDRGRGRFRALPRDGLRLIFGRHHLSDWMYALRSSARHGSMAASAFSERIEQKVGKRRGVEIRTSDRDKRRRVGICLLLIGRNDVAARAPSLRQRATVCGVRGAPGVPSIAVRAVAATANAANLTFCMNCPRRWVGAAGASLFLARVRIASLEKVQELDLAFGRQEPSWSTSAAVSDSGRSAAASALAPFASASPWTSSGAIAETVFASSPRISANNALWM